MGLSFSVSNAKGPITHGAELSQRVGEKVFKRGCGAARGCRFFFFPGSSANKDAGIAPMLFVSIIFFLAFWQCQMKKDLTEKEEGENIKEA